MRPGKDGWRIKRRACSFYIPYPNRITYIGHSHGKDAQGKVWTGKCIIKDIPQTSYFTCHECQDHQERAGFEIHIINKFTVSGKSIKTPKNLELD